MTAETDLQTLISTMEPTRHSGQYVFVSLPSLPAGLATDDIIMSFREAEGLTLIVAQAVADNLGLAYDYVAAWITLTVHSSLAAVGLTAAFANALAAQGISCNVVAGFYHDHLFVASDDAEAAMAALQALSQGG